ncbi:ABC transporter permease [Flexivirga meconopsidis]|uniref:ABC transporter permease n=1 Tax=Flexivirga meconopsidis TaxID=2977121 RepID=UPI00223EE3B0|nr:ABC transporter permease [Flexivirga meconopsidis]
MTTGSVWRIVAAREIAVKLRDRNFLVSTGLMLVLIIVGLGIQVFLGGKSQTKTVAVASPAASSIVTQSGKTADAAGSDLELKAKTVASTQAVDQAVKDGKADAGLVPQGKGWRLIGKSSRNTELATYVGQTVSTQAIARNAAAAGTSLDALQQGAKLQYDLLQPKGDDNTTEARVSAVAFGFLFYLAALLFGMAIANSVVEEKQNRIVEIIASAIPLRQLLIGKVVGNTVLAIAQVGLLAVVAVGGLVVTDNAGLLSTIAGGIGWFLPFFLIGFLALASLWAVVGALATRMEDVQSTSAPMTSLVMAIFLGGILATGGLLKILSFVPLFSTIAMPARVVSGDASWWEPLASLGIAAVGAYYILRMAERMYRSSLMQTSRKLSFRQALAESD